MGITFLHKDINELAHSLDKNNNSTQHISSIELDHALIKKLSPTLLAEKTVYVNELLAENFFLVYGDTDIAPPYNIKLSSTDNRLYIKIQNTDFDTSIEHMLSLRSFKRHIKDYFLICESYYQALRQNLSRLEALDMGRKALHDEAGQMIVDSLEPKIKIDLKTARRLFTLICILQIKQY